MGARNRVGIGLSYPAARLHRLAEFIPWNRGFHRRLKTRALDWGGKDRKRPAQDTGLNGQIKKITTGQDIVKNKREIYDRIGCND
jgi:hypothetical protein